MPHSPDRNNDSILSTRFGMSRRDLMRLTAVGGVVFASGLPGRRLAAATDDFYFVQLSDLHWGFADPKVNPDTKASLEKAIAAVNAVSPQPDFIVFTGDLTHLTKDPAERRKRMTEVKAMLGGLANQNHLYLAGEHDAGADHGAAFLETFGKLNYTFDHKGLHFIALDNVSDPQPQLGEAQLEWLAADLKGRDPAAPIVVLAHRPLFDLKPEWDWATKDGAKAVAMLQSFQHVTVFYGHVHQELSHQDGNVLHISARSAMYPLPSPPTPGKKAPLPWDASASDHGIGWRVVATGSEPLKLESHPTV
ncbi:MAG TPA: metallophosphoesterase [Candidatus Binatia bacterium]|nr:metallophosphoesterase [Candidatus Binatia bacterium]